MYKKILVTGGTGFVGNNLIGPLKHYYPTSEIFVIDSKICNLMDYYKTQNYISKIDPDCVIHLAAKCGGIGANKEAPATFMRHNLEMGLNLINSCLKLSHLKKFVMLGSICAYPKFTKVPFKESDLWNGYPEETNAPYGIAKKTLIELLMSCHKEYGFKSVNILPTNLFGPYDHFNLTTSHVIPAIILKVYNAIIKGENKISVWGTGNVTREFLYVKDLVNAIILVLEHDIGPEPINIGTGKEISIQNLVTKICKMMNYNGEIVFDPTYPDGQPRRCVDIKLAKKLLGYSPTINLDTGLQYTIEWFLQNVNNINTE